MRYLIFCHIFSHRMYALASWLNARANAEVMIVSSAPWQCSELRGVRRVHFRASSRRETAGGIMGQWEDAVQKGKQALSTLETVRATGFVPDIILNSSVSGAGLCLRQAFPEAFLVHYIERVPNAADAKFRDILHAVQTSMADISFAWEGFPGILRAPLAVDTDYFRPAGVRRGKNIIFGFVSQPLVSLLKNIAGAEDLSGVTILLPGRNVRKKLEEEGVVPENVNLEVNPTFERLREIFSAASVYVRPAKGSGIPVELLLAMSAGVAVMTDCANPFFRPGVNCLRIRRGQGVLKSLEDPNLEKIGASARRDVMRNFGLEAALPAHFEKIMASRDQKSR